MGCTFAAFISGVLSERGYKFEGIKRYELNPDQTFNDLDFLTKEKFDFTYYFEVYKDVEISEVASTLSEEFGILLIHERTDTVRMGYYFVGEQLITVVPFTISTTPKMESWSKLMDILVAYNRQN
ncbi:MAG: hypothetical protein P1U56_06290 [Saprospiraceae bacterium]|nr:hypothetical protein [Saprospiraceae bacterium]